jgi:predicted transposase YbfD/YdcC
MLMAVCALMGGIDSFVGMDDYAKIHKEFFDRYCNHIYTPSHDTFRNLFRDLNMQEFESWFRKTAEQLRSFMDKAHLPVSNRRKHYALDGKTVRNSGIERSFHIVTAWLSGHKISMGQITVDKKSNEITAMPKLLSALDINGAVITSDAMGCQHELCSLIIKKGGDYIIAVKENQPTLYHNVVAQVEENFESAYSQCTTNEKGHGRIETRTCLVMEKNEEDFNFKNWPGLKTLICVDADVTRKNKKGEQKRSLMTRYFISSMKLDAPETLDIIRAHWGIENNLHWCLDVSLNEDKACILEEKAVVNINILRKFVFNIFTAVKDKKSFPSMFRQCMNPQNSVKFLDKCVCS